MEICDNCGSNMVKFDMGLWRVKCNLTTHLKGPVTYVQNQELDQFTNVKFA